MAMPPDLIELEDHADLEVGDRRNWFVRVIADSRQAQVGLAVLAAFVLMAIFAPWIEPYDVHAKVGPVFGHPSVSHPFGLDDAGHDMLSLLIQGGRISLIVGFAAAFVAMVIGGGIGLLAGYFGG